MSVVAIDDRSASTVGRHARLELRFERRGARTVVSHAYAEPPLRIGRTFTIGDAAYVILVAVAPGVFPGDCLNYHVSVGSGARVLVASQSALQVHPADTDAAAAVRFDVQVEEGGELACHWDPVIPFAGSRLIQRINLRAAAHSRLYWSDGLMSGRAGRGEAWQFESVDHELRLETAGSLSYLERYRLLPRERQPERTWLAGRADYIGTMLVHDRDLTPGLVDIVRERLGAARATLSVDLVDVAQGVLVGRFMTHHGPSWHEARVMCRDVVLEQVFKTAADAFRR